MQKRAESAFLASMLVCLLIIVTCSIAVIQFERPAGGNIATPEDAMWWAVSTMTTVGYGDRFPVTSEGRMIAIFLMAAGVGAFGTLSGLMASWFLSPEAEIGNFGAR
jgi:voltage-gated potassium channel